MMSLDDDEVKDVEFIKLKFDPEQKNSYLIPLKLHKHCRLFVVGLQDPINAKSKNESDYELELYDSKKQILNVPMLDYIFKDYLFQFETLPNKGTKCKKTVEFIEKIYSENGMEGLQILSDCSNYLDINYLTDCVAQKIAEIFKKLSPEEIFKILQKKISKK